MNKKKPDYAVMKTPYWEEKVLRPNQKTILSYEIYKQPSMPSEKNTIKILNELIEENKVKFVWSRGFLWHTLNE